MGCMAEKAFPANLWDIDQLAAHLKTSKNFVYALTAQRRIGFLRVGKFIRFTPEQVADYISSVAEDAETRSTGRRIDTTPAETAERAEQAFSRVRRNVGGRPRVVPRSSGSTTGRAFS